MTKIETIIGYHGTTKTNAFNIYSSQCFIPNEDEQNKLFLGRGIYFYCDKKDAVFWNIKNMRDARLKQEYMTYVKEYDILEVLIGVEEEELLDLDDLNNYLKFQNYCERVSNVLKTSDFYKNAQNKDAAIINFMEKRGELGKTKVIKKIYSQSNRFFDKIKVYRTMLCVKDKSLIDAIMVSETISESIFNMVYKVSFGEQPYA